MNIYNILLIIVIKFLTLSLSPLRAIENTTLSWTSTFSAFMYRTLRRVIYKRFLAEPVVNHESAIYRSIQKVAYYQLPPNTVCYPTNVLAAQAKLWHEGGAFTGHKDFSPGTHTADCRPILFIRHWHLPCVSIALTKPFASGQIVDRQ